MTPPKPLAAPSLLARKGAARPAMRSQDVGGAMPADSTDDLGWNDMGADAAQDSPAMPPVLVEREALKSGIELRSGMAASVSRAKVQRIGREAARKTDGTKAAFTLRLDADRHLRLRLASAVTKSSSQHLVIQALDAFLQRLPEVDALVAQLPQSKPRKR